MDRESIAAGIMAHNEEKVIAKCIDSLLLQKLGGKYTLQIYAVANACTDRTVEIVKKKCADASGLHLIEVLEKGKTNAISVFKERIRILNDQLLKEKQIQKLLFMDADASFENEDAVYLMAEALNKRSDLCAILPFGLPGENSGCKSAFVWRLYKAKAALASAVEGSAFSGQCYMIRNEVAQRMEIPKYIMLEDFYISEKLRRGYIRDYNIRYFYTVPPNFRAEVKRVFRHSLGNAQMRSFFGRGLFRQPLVEWAAPVERNLYDRGALRRQWWKMRWQQKLLLFLYYLIGKAGDIRARFLIQKYGPKNINLILDQWRTIR